MPSALIEVVSLADQRDDIVDETLNSFRACVLFRSFEPEGSADKVLLYLLLFTLQVRTLDTCYSLPHRRVLMLCGCSA